MDEYIDRRGLIAALNTFAPEQYTVLLNQLITEYPTADVVEVKHGRWIEDSLIDGASFCSLCGYEDYRYDNDRNEWGSKYCPNCGAKMDGEK